MPEVTAKVTLSNKQTPGWSGAGSTSLTFTPDYQDGRNKAWATATPGLNLTMTVKDEVAEHFDLHGKYTLVFQPTDESDTAGE